MSLLTNGKALAAFFPFVDARYYSEDEGWADGRDYGRCTMLNSSMVTLLRKEGRQCAIYGAEGPAMDTAEKWHHHGGHDWLLVDDRWIVDLWVPIYLDHAESRNVWDLEAGGSPYLPRRDLWEPPVMAEFEPWFVQGAEDWRDHLKSFQSTGN